MLSPSTRPVITATSSALAPRSSSRADFGFAVSRTPMPGHWCACSIKTGRSLATACEVGNPRARRPLAPRPSAPALAISPSKSPRRRSAAATSSSPAAVGRTPPLDRVNRTIPSRSSRWRSVLLIVDCLRCKASAARRRLPYLTAATTNCRWRSPRSIALSSRSEIGEARQLQCHFCTRTSIIDFECVGPGEATVDQGVKDAMHANPQVGEANKMGGEPGLKSWPRAIVGPEQLLRLLLSHQSARTHRVFGVYSNRRSTYGSSSTQSYVCLNRMRSAHPGCRSTKAHLLQH
jgi:hypothetical protein